MSIRKFVLDKNIILDIILPNSQNEQQAKKVFEHFKTNTTGYVPVCILPSLDYLIRKNSPEVIPKFYELVSALTVCKTPSYIDFQHPLAKVAIEIYLIDISARAIGASVLTNDLDFITNSDNTISYTQFFDLIEKKSPEENIPFLSLGQLNRPFEKEFEKAYDEVIKSGWYILGNQLKTFEEEYAKFNKIRYCIGVGNGLDALILSLKALDVGPGDEVIVPSNTYIASWLAVSYVGATIVPVEPRLDTYNIDPSLIEAKITSKTKVIMPVNLYGQAAELHEIAKIAKKHAIHIVEDNAQSQGAMCNGKLTGTFGDINGTSFYPGKNLGALGDGGAITTNAEDLACKVEKLRNYGSSRKYYNDVKGYNSRLDEMQSAFLSVKLQALNEDNAKRVKVAHWYNKVLEGKGDLVLPRLADGCTSVFHLYVIRTKWRNELQEYLAKHSIGTVIHYPIAPHLQEAYQDLGFKKGDFPLAEEIADTCLSLPLYPEMQQESVLKIGRCIQEFFNGR
jgi:dTDP-4-amino-4,6-dideoxygalactose transaminase